MTRRSSSEAAAWLLFSAGGMASALVVPVLLLLLGLAFPAGLLMPPDHADLLALLDNPLVCVVLLALCVLSLLFGRTHSDTPSSTAYSSRSCGPRSTLRATRQPRPGRYGQRLSCSADAEFRCTGTLAPPVVHETLRTPVDLPVACRSRPSMIRTATDALTRPSCHRRPRPPDPATTPRLPAAEYQPIVPIGFARLRPQGPTRSRWSTSGSTTKPSGFARQSTRRPAPPS
jgi:hypothetical protein